MANLRLLGIASIVAGAAMLAVAASRGELRGGLFLIVPYFVGTGLLSFGGMILVFAGITIWFFSRIQLVAPPAAPPQIGPEAGAPTFRAERRHGGVALIGPIPIVWGSDRGVTRTMILAGAALLALAIVLALVL